MSRFWLVDPMRTHHEVLHPMEDGERCLCGEYIIAPRTFADHLQEVDQ